MFILIVLSVLIMDQLTKFLSFTFLQPEGTIPVINKYFYLTYVENYSTVAYMLQNKIVLCIAIIITIAAFIYGYRDKHLCPVVRYGIALITGGAAGNIIDNIRHGYIIGYFDFLMCPVFNLSDICIAIGMIVIVIYSLLTRQKIRS